MLNGYRVLDLSDEKGHLCGRLLGDLGADVIKIEPPGGDASRRLGPFYHDEPQPERSLYWFAYNANKRGVTLNLETADGRALFRRLAESSDLIIDCFQPGRLASLGLGHEDLKAHRPQLVVTSITPYGQTGPDAQRDDTDLILMARGGLLNLCGEDDGRPPSRMKVPQSNCLAGAQAAMASTAALLHGERTGMGQHIDVSVQEAVLNSLISAQQSWDVLGVNERRGTRQLRGGAVLGRYSWPCEDGFINWCWWVAPGWGYKMYPIMEWMTEEDMAGDLWENDWESRSTNELGQDEVDHWEDLFGAFFKTHTKAHIFEEALKRRVMLFPTFTSADLLRYNQLQERGYFQQVEHPELGATITYPGPFVQSTENMWSMRLRPPRIGEHNREIYGQELGLSDGELGALKAAGAI